MKKSMLFSTLFALGIASSANAQTFHIPFNGKSVTMPVHLENNDVIIVDTTVNVGTRFFVKGLLVSRSQEEQANFQFVSSVVGVEPARNGEFIDKIFAGCNPGWVSYTFTGQKPTNAVFTVYSR